MRKRAGKEPTAAAPVAQRAARDMSSDVYGVSDRELNRRASTQDVSAAVAAHGPVRGNAQKTKAMQESRRRRDEAMARLENLTSTTSNHAVQSSDPAESPAVEVGRRAQVATRQRRAPDASGVDLDDDMFGDMDTSFDDQDLESPPAARSTETSTFNVGLFKRGRPRQSSIVGRDDEPIRPSSRGANTSGLSSTFNLGMFKRRPREPSILGTSQNSRAQGPEPETSSEDGQEEDGEAASGPEAESTPLSRNKTRVSATSSGEALLEGPLANPKNASPRKAMADRLKNGGRILTLISTTLSKFPPLRRLGPGQNSGRLPRILTTKSWRHLPAADHLPLVRP